MTPINIDLTGAAVRVIGNIGDEHLVRLSNPAGQDLIAAGGQYEADLTPALAGASEPVDLDDSAASTGVLTLPITITAGVYRVRRLDPRRTIMSITVEAR